MNENDDYSKETFLDKIYQDLHMSDEVMHTATPSDKKEEKIRKYLERLEKIENKASENKYHDYDKLKELFYKKYIIKPENIPESYYELQKRLMLERGYGHIELDQLTKDEMAETIINDQKKSLDMWLDYLIKNDAKYPEWFKYYAFQGMVRLGTYSKETGRFGKRSKTTTQIFADLNREALALIYDSLTNLLDKKEIEEKDLQKLLEGGSFSKLYAHFLQKLENNRKELNNPEDGIWIKYKRGSEPDELVNSIEGKGTGWCTAGMETARSQLRGGDFYVYYTKDSDGNYKQPRLAIRMEGNQIGEIRGVARDQNIEPELKNVLEEKLKEFPDRDKYLKKVSDMEKLTQIYNNSIHIELTEEELRFLYQVDNRIEGFGYTEDPRIDDIIYSRNRNKDLAKIFHCEPEEISTDPKDVFHKNNIKYFYGDLDLNLTTNVRESNLTMPENVVGSLSMKNLLSAEGLILPKNITRSLYLDRLKSAVGLVLPDTIREDLVLNGLTSAEGLKLPQNIGGNLILSLTSAKDLKLPQNIGGSLILNGLESAEELNLPQDIDWSLELPNLTSAKGLRLPQNMRGNLILNNLASGEDLKIPQNIDGDVSLAGLTSAKGLELPQNMRGSLILNSLASAEDLKLPQSIGGILSLPSLTSVEDLILPQDVGGVLYLDNLTYAKNLTLPQKVEKLYLGKLTSLEGINVPKGFTCGFLNSPYFTIEDLVNKSLEQETEINYKRKGFSNIPLLIFASYVTSLILVFLILSILK